MGVALCKEEPLSRAELFGRPPSLLLDGSARRLGSGRMLYSGSAPSKEQLPSRAFFFQHLASLLPGGLARRNLLAYLPGRKEAGQADQVSQKAVVEAEAGRSSLGSKEATGRGLCI